MLGTPVDEMVGIRTEPLVVTCILAVLGSKRGGLLVMGESEMEITSWDDLMLVV